VAHIAELRGAVLSVCRKCPFHIDAWVVLPEHMHCLWTLPKGDSNFPERWQAIKIEFTKALPAIEQRLPVNDPPTRARHLATPLLGACYSRRSRLRCPPGLHYIHFNPVRHRLAEGPGDWPFSTLHRCVAAGPYHPDWLPAGAEPVETSEREDDERRTTLRLSAVRLYDYRPSPQAR
jgi:REP-associated tyrosine transposase